MLKLFRSSHIVLRLCESKQCIKFGIFNNTMKEPIVTNFNRTLKKYYSKQQLEDESVKNEYTDIQDIVCGNPDIEQKLKIIALETEVMRQEGRNTPTISFLKKQHWEELLKLPTRTARKRYLTFLFKIEMKKDNIKDRKEQKRLEREMNPKPEFNTEDGQIIYSLMHNNIFLRFYDTTINHLYNSKLIEAIMFGQQLVVDCGYDKHMTSRENINCAKQLMYLFADNRAHVDPYDLHFCNFGKETTLAKSLHRHIKTMYEPWFPLHIHEENYSDVFPNKKLIYLTPHCREEMTEYDHDAIYIIGGIVDKINNEPVSMAKAKREGLKMLKLPLDKYLQWGAGSGKSLTLNHMILILLDVKKTGDWSYALRHVPRRKLEIAETVYPNLNKSRTLSYDKDDARPIKSRRHVREYDDRIKRDGNNSRSKFQVRSLLNDD